MNVPDERLMRARIMERVKKPFSHEAVFDRKAGRTVYRVRDANDDPMCHTVEECYAEMIVEALNKLERP